MSSELSPPITNRQSPIVTRHLLFIPALALLGWVLARAPLREAGTALRELALTDLLALLLLNGLILLALNGRWWLILRAQGHTLPYLTLTAHRLAAFGVSYFTPGPQFGGEPLQVLLLERRHGVPRPSAIATVTLDKLLELLANFLFLAVGITWVLRQGIASQGHNQAAFIPLLPLAAILLFLAALYAGQRPLTRLLRLVKRFPLWHWLPRWHENGRRLSATLQASETQLTQLCRTAPQVMLLALLVSLFSWTLLITEYALMLRFLGVHLGAAQTVAMLTAARIAFLLPMPGALGTLEAGQVLMLQWLGFNPGTAVAASLLIRARDSLLALLGLAWAAQKWKRANNC